jgi:CubicO group peptidase (beta-lactamase class C family)
MFTNQIPQFPNFGRQPVAGAKPLLANPSGDIYPNNNKPQGHGLSFMITGGVTGRSDGTAGWAGLGNVFWWADREKEVGGIIATQILPLGDMDATMLSAQLEATVYAALT